MSNYKEIAKHSGNYFLAMVATKALAFISLPVFTYLLTVEEYGIYNVFISTVGITTIILTLNTEVAVSRYYYDSKDIHDFKRFVGTTVKLSTLVFVFMSILLIIFVEPISDYLGFENLLTISLIPVSFYNITNSIFQQIYQPMLASKKIAIVSSVQTYLAFGLSILFIITMSDKKYYGQVYGTMVAMLILSSYLFKQIKTYCKGGVEFYHVKYILSFSLPYLPYSLSGIIVAQFGKLMLGQESGFETAGQYSFASNVAMLMMVFIVLIHNAWNPYYFRYMNCNDSKSIDNDYDLIWRITLIIAIILSLFCFELGSVLGNEDYVDSLFMIPILTLGYCFYQWAYVYMRNVGYAKKTIWNSIVVIISGVFNVLINYWFYNYYGVWGVALSFMFSYMVMFLLSYVINKYVLKIYAPNIIQFMKPFAIFLIFWSTSIYLCSLHGLLFFFLKMGIVSIFVFIVSFQYKAKMIMILRKIKYSRMHRKHNKLRNL